MTNEVSLYGQLRLVVCLEMGLSDLSGYGASATLGLKVTVLLPLSLVQVRYY